MKHNTITFLLAAILSCSLVNAAGQSDSWIPFSNGNNSPIVSPANPNSPFSSGKANRPILRAGDYDDTGDSLNNTDGDDQLGNVNDNNVPTNNGVWIVVSIAFVYAIKLAVTRRREPIIEEQKVIYN